MSKTQTKNIVISYREHGTIKTINEFIVPIVITCDCPETTSCDFPEEQEDDYPILDASDGPEGFLWKASEHHGGKLVVLTPEEDDFSFLAVERRDGSTEFLDYTGRSNGNRQTWRGALKPGKYRPSSLVQGLVNGDVAKAWRIGKSRRRND